MAVPVRGRKAGAGRLADEVVRAHETFLLIAFLSEIGNKVVSSKSGYESSFSSLRTENVCTFTLGKGAERADCWI